MIVKRMLLLWPAQSILWSDFLGVCTLFDQLHYMVINLSCNVLMLRTQDLSQRQYVFISLFEQVTTVFLHLHKVRIKYSLLSSHTAKLNLIRKLVQFENCQQGC